ncbi:glutamate-1-semialdehyde 2,1-aminomutase [Streptomyces ambofaciens]
MHTEEPELPRSRRANERLHALVPGGAHTYAKGDDQYPENLAPVISHGRGAHVWDVDGNRYIEYGSGLRSVSLGHAHPRVTEAVRREIDRGSNFVRPSIVEVEAAERFLATVPTAEMVKFAKNGSDATTAAVRLARAATGRARVAVCADHPFFSVDDWFIGTTPMSAGVPAATEELTVAFPYGDLAATEELLTRYRDEVACLILEPAAHTEPPPGYLAGLRELADRHGCVLVFDEMITGFRWSEAGAQGLYGVVPDLSTFGKALGNGFAVSALAGRRDLMERGGLRHSGERVFLLSTTHGAETHALAAAMAVQATYTEEQVTARLHALGERLAARCPRRRGEHGRRRPRRRPGAGQQPGLRHPRREPAAVAAVPHPVPAPTPRGRGAGPVVRGEQRARRGRHRSHRRRGGPGLRGVPEGAGRRRPHALDGRTGGEAGLPPPGVS